VPRRAPCTPKPVSVDGRVLARFLCGIATPLTSRVKAKSLAGSGQLAAHPFARVLTAVQQAYP